MPNLEIPRDVTLTISGFFAVFAPDVDVSQQTVTGLRIMAGTYGAYSGSGFPVFDGTWKPAYALRLLDTDLETPATARAKLFEAAGQTAPPLPDISGDSGREGEPVVAAPDTGAALSFSGDNIREQHLLYRHEGETVHDVQLRKDGLYCIARVPHAAAGVEGAAPAAGAMYDLVFALPREGTRVSPVKIHLARIADSARPFHHFCFFQAADGYAGPERLHLADATRG